MDYLGYGTMMKVCVIMKDKDTPVQSQKLKYLLIKKPSYQ